MTTNEQQTTQQVEGQTLDSVRQAQEAVVKTTQTFSEAWANAIGQFLPGAQGSASALNLRDLVNRTFDFGEQLLSAQREFAHRLMQAAAPAMRATEEAAGDVARHIDDRNERDERREQIQQANERREQIQQANERSEQIHEEANQRSERIQQVMERDEQTQEAKEAPTPLSPQQNADPRASADQHNSSVEGSPSRQLNGRRGGSA